MMRKLEHNKQCLLLTLPTQKEMLFMIVWNKQMLSKNINIISDVMESSASDCIALCKKNNRSLIYQISLYIFNIFQQYEKVTKHNNANQTLND